MTVIPFPGVDIARVERAGAHVVAEAVLDEEARLRPPVTDLDIARLLYALESGTQVIQGGPDRWTVPAHSPLIKRNLAGIVDEALRLGLVRAVSASVSPSVVRVYLDPAPVHYGAHMKPLCAAFGPIPLRPRVSRDWRAVDCGACLQAY